MGKDPILFAMTNPDPEIMPEKAEPFAKIVATRRSDYPNQINNVLCFPGLFKGAFSCLARTTNEDMKLAAAKAISASVPEEFLQVDYIIPTILIHQLLTMLLGQSEMLPLQVAWLEENLL